ncbi:MAG: hypothetical protein P8188_19455 [Gemmatimonadota bacterium]
MDEQVVDSDKGGMREEMDHRLMARIASLESDVRSLRVGNRLLGVALLVALALSALAVLRPQLLSGGGTHTVLQAQDFVLLGPDGETRGRWSVSDDGLNVSFSLRDLRESPRLTLTAGGEGPGLSLANAAGESRVALGLLADETASLVFADRTGQTRAVFGLIGGGSAASLGLADADGQSRIGFGVDAAGVGTVLLPEEMSASEGDEGEG